MGGKKAREGVAPAGKQRAHAISEQETTWWTTGSPWIGERVSLQPKWVGRFRFRFWFVGFVPVPSDPVASMRMGDDDAKQEKRGARVSVCWDGDSNRELHFLQTSHHICAARGGRRLLCLRCGMCDDGVRCGMVVCSVGRGCCAI